MKRKENEKELWDNFKIGMPKGEERENRGEIFEIIMAKKCSKINDKHQTKDPGYREHK